MPKHVLVSLLGRTPQIFTETLYVLMIEKKIPISEIWIVTTHEGKQDIEEKLLVYPNGKYFQFCMDYNIDPDNIQFSNNHIITSTDSEYTIPGKKLCEPLQKEILSLFKKLTKDDNTKLYCSLAGGRKTMSVYFAFALQLFGRNVDTLFHILTHPEDFQNHPEFYYIPPRHKILEMQTGIKRSTEEASISLVEVPYIRLSNMMAYLMDGEQNLDFNNLVQATQAQLEQMPKLPVLIIDVRNKLIIIGKHEISLSPIEMAFYYYYAKRSYNRPDHIPVNSYVRYFETADGAILEMSTLKTIIEIYKKIASTGVVERFIQTLDKGRLEFLRVIQYVSRIKRKINATIKDESIRQYYHISSTGNYGKGYGIKMDKSKMIFRNEPILDECAQL